MNKRNSLSAAKTLMDPHTSIKAAPDQYAFAHLKNKSKFQNVSLIADLTQSSKDLKIPSESKKGKKAIPPKQATPQPEEPPKNDKPKYCAFTTLKEQTGLLCLSEKEIQQRVLLESVHETNDLKYFMSVNSKAEKHQS